jgi:S-adenosylmethionine:tRNA ribosyltransferase-isomerase
MRGLTRDGVRLLVAYRHDLRLVDAYFRDLPGFLTSGDLLVINNSATLPASIRARRADGMVLDLHLSTPVLPSGVAPDLTRTPQCGKDTWIIELRQRAGDRSVSFRLMRPGELLSIPDGSAEILGPYPPHSGSPNGAPRESRLWRAALHLPSPVGSYLERHGHPIRYSYASREWPTSYYQNVYAIEAGSVEMPSAGRAFTPEMITELVSRGIDIAPITLHAGVASLEDHELPLNEFYRVPDETARRIRLTREAGGRVIAIGTTVVRAIETVADDNGDVRGGEGWTKLVITPERGVRAVDGLLTGWHEPRASHLLLLEAVAGRKVLDLSYRTALERRYLWHEFGDLHLLLP